MQGQGQASRVFRCTEARILDADSRHEYQAFGQTAIGTQFRLDNMRRNSFTITEKEVLEDLGWTINYDLVGEVYVRLCYGKNDIWAVLCADGEIYTIKTDNIDQALGVG